MSARTWLPVLFVLGLTGDARGDERPFRPVPLARAQTLAIEKAWSGYGCSHRFEAAMRRRGETFVGMASLEAHAPFGRVLGPFPSRRVSVPRSVVAALARATDAARAAMRREPPERVGAGWTDDFPSGAMTFRGSAGMHRIRVGGQSRVLSLEYGESVEVLNRPVGSRDARPPIWEAYEAVLDAVGATSWIDEACREVRGEDP